MGYGTPRIDIELEEGSWQLGPRGGPMVSLKVRPGSAIPARTAGRRPRRDDAERALQRRGYAFQEEMLDGAYRVHGGRRAEVWLMLEGDELCGLQFRPRLTDLGPSRHSTDEGELNEAIAEWERDVSELCGALGGMLVDFQAREVVPANEFRRVLEAASGEWMSPGE